MCVGMVATAQAQGLLGRAASLDRSASGATQRVDTLEVEWVADRVAAAPGETLWLALRLKHDAGWHTYWQNPGDSGLPTTLSVEGPPGVQFGPLQWPLPTRFWVGPLANYGYEGEVFLPLALTLPAQGPEADGPWVLRAAVSWLICKEVCIPGQAKLTLALPVRAVNQAPVASRVAPAIEQALARVPEVTRPLAARWIAEAGGISLVVDDAAGGAASRAEGGPQSPRRVEFFPAVPGWMSAPAPQSLYIGSNGWRLALVPAEAASAPPALIEGALHIDGQVAWLRASQTSAPIEGGRLQSVAARPDAGSDRQPASQTPVSGLAGAMLLGALGGLLLNLMPCVFPVVGLKLASLAGGDPRSPAGRSALRGGLWAFVLGILVCFGLLAGVMLVLREAGQAIGWGFQLQSPGFVAAMALLFMAIGLNFSGVFEIGLSLTRLGQLEHQRATRSASEASSGPPTDRAGHVGSSFLSGVLAVLVATPCTAPFMGSAVGLTLSLPAGQAMAVFLSVGLGMALPYLLLGFWPAGLSRLPRPGRWMQTFKHSLAFPMYASASWLAWVLAQQSDPDGVLRLLLAAVLLAFAVWAWDRSAAATASAWRGLWWGLAAAGLIGAAVLWSGIDAKPAPSTSSASSASSTATAATPASVTSSSRPGAAALDAPGLTWTPWSEAAVAQARAAGRPVFVDFTAAWCVSCQVNKRLVLESESVRTAFARAQVTLLQADWTRQDAAITAELARHGRNGVPLYLVYLPEQPAPRVLPELLTARMVLEALGLDRP
jgi:thiol:disulfide interchange protein/DsbC/DsbD-like thiol-disulfide interchange protein